MDKNRKGAISIEMIIIIILALLVLVIIAASFTGGMTELWRKITGYYRIYGAEEIAAARLRCDNWCATGDTASWCTGVALNETALPTPCYDIPIKHKCMNWSKEETCGITTV